MRRSFSIRCKSIWAVLVLMPVLSACASAPPVPEEHYYRLQAEFASTPMSHKLFAGTIEVEPLVGEGLVNERFIVYSERDKPNQLKAYHYHLWNETPSIMLGSELISFLRASNVAGQIVTPALRVRADYVLNGRIKRLERIVGESNRTMIALELALRSATGGKLVFLNEYRHENDALGPDIASAVDALNTSLTIIYSDFLNDLAQSGK